MALLRRQKSLLGVCGFAISLAWASALADLPGVLDRVPTDAPVVITLRNAEEFTTKLNALLAKLGNDESESPLGDADELLKLEGIDKTGSAALVMPAGYEKFADAKEDDEDAPDGIVALVPVKDGAAFIKALGGTGEGVVELTKIPGAEEGEPPTFAKDIGGGYVALSPAKELLESFQGDKGQLEAHKKALGVAGNRVVDSSQLAIIANIPLMKDRLKSGMDEFSQQAEANMSMMGGDGAGGQIALAKIIGENFLRDAQVAVNGVSIVESGVELDVAAQFKEGSELAAFFQTTGNASALASRLPNIPFMFMVNADTSSPGIKKIMNNVSEMAKAAPGADAASGWQQLLSKSDSIDGIGFIMGATPGLFAGGLLANTVQFIATKDSAGFVDAYRTGIEATNGKTIAGVTYQTKFEPAAVDVSGTKVDRWSMQMQVDPNHESAMQLQQMQMMLYGPTGGPSGLLAPVDGGLVATFAPNSTLMGQALTAAKENKGIGDDAAIRTASERLPKGRTIEAFIGTKSLLDLAVGAMAMMGGGADIQVPASLPPIAMGGTTDAGAVHFKVHVPVEVITAIGEMSKSMRGGEEAEEEEPAPADSGKPSRF